MARSSRGWTRRSTESNCFAGLSVRVAAGYGACCTRLRGHSSVFYFVARVNLCARCVYRESRDLFCALIANMICSPDRLSHCQETDVTNFPQNIQHTWNIVPTKTSESTTRFGIMYLNKSPSSGALSGRRRYLVPYPSRLQLARGWGRYRSFSTRAPHQGQLFPGVALKGHAFSRSPRRAPLVGVVRRADGISLLSLVPHISRG